MPCSAMPPHGSGPAGSIAIGSRAVPAKCTGPRKISDAPFAMRSCVPAAIRTGCPLSYTRVASISTTPGPSSTAPASGSGMLHGCGETSPAASFGTLSGASTVAGTRASSSGGAGRDCTREPVARFKPTAWTRSGVHAACSSKP